MWFSVELYKYVCLSALISLCGCGSYTKASGMRPEDEANMPAGGCAVEFIGVPILGDYDDNRDLDFVIRVEQAGRVLKIWVHEDSRLGNGGLLNDLQNWVNEFVDSEEVKVAGKFIRYHEDGVREYGRLELEKIAFQGGESGFDEPYNTDPPRSLFYSVPLLAGVIFYGFSH